MRRLEEYSAAVSTIFTLILRVPFIFTFRYHFLFLIHPPWDFLLPSSPLFSSSSLHFLLLRHSQSTEWAPCENWNMLTFTGRRKGELRRKGEKTKDVEGLNHKGCGRLDFTGGRVPGNYWTFKIRKGLARYITWDMSTRKLSAYTSCLCSSFV